MKDGAIHVALIENPHPGSVGAISNRLIEEFGAAVSILDTPIDPATAFDPHRRQYNAVTLLEELCRVATDDDTRILGITGLDLFVPPLAFVFGEAPLNDRAAIVSSFRLRPEFYGLARDDRLTLERLRKFCIHMVGHTYGLTHCEDYRCAVHASTSVEDIDVRMESLCNSCRSALSG